MKTREFYKRKGDMDPYDFISLIMEDDGDIIITAVQNNRRCVIQFCTRAGGGKSQKTRAALIQLAEAIECDNREDPQ